MDKGFKELGELLIEYIRENHNPHTKIIIDFESAEIVEGIRGITLDKPHRDYKIKAGEGEPSVEVRTCSTCHQEVDVINRYVPSKSGEVGSYKVPCSTCDHRRSSVSELPCAFCTQAYNG